MLAPNELSFDEILKFMLAHNGKVTNHELVKHFKVFLMNPDMKDEARSTFKKHVNTLANIKNQNNEKWLILKKKYVISNNKSTDNSSESKPSESSNVTQEDNVSSEPVPARPPLPLQLNQDFSILNNLIQNHPSAYPLQNDSVSLIPSVSKESLASVPSISSDDAPPVAPRRKSSDKQTSIPNLLSPRFSIPSQDISEIIDEPANFLTPSKSETMLVDNEQKISVKERKQMFNRMASEGDGLKPHIHSNLNNQSLDEEDRVSLDQKSETDPLDSKQKQWILCSARGDYHSLAKMCKENQKLAKTKDPFTTAMHWAAKRGDDNLVKLLAGVNRQLVNERSGYTPLHIAMQYRQENVYKLLVEVYDADPNCRDWSGKKPRQYLANIDTSLSPGSYRMAMRHPNFMFLGPEDDDESVDYQRRTVTPIPARASSITVYTSKKENFLRIGSLNVRVKKTTEAFSNFLGVGATRSSAYIPKSGRDREIDRRSDDGELHKSWGSADNIQKDEKTMPPPMSNKIRRRGASGRRGLSSHSRSTPSTPDQPRAHIGVTEEADSDSDTAAGFHTAWKQRASNCT